MALLPLSFGQSRARRFTSAAAAAEAVATTIPSLQMFDLPGPGSPAIASADLVCGSVKVATNSVTPCRVTVTDSQGWHFFVSVAGQSKTLWDRNEINLLPGQNMMIMPNLPRTSDRTNSSAFVAAFDIDELLKRQRAMSGAESIVHVPDDRPTKIPLGFQPALWRTFTHICKIIDACGEDSALAARLGVDDLIYRWLATTLLEAEDTAETQHVPRGRVDFVCDYIRATIDVRPLTLTEMENASALSARSLQYGFMRRFGCSPMQWQQRERMIRVRERLFLLPPDATITELAYEIGFSTLSALTTLYKRHFGETPIQTITSARIHRNA
jgi:AraC-like DNA-binding protein